MIELMMVEKQWRLEPPFLDGEKYSFLLVRLSNNCYNWFISYYVLTSICLTW